jgi:hypothetical protein
VSAINPARLGDLDLRPDETLQTSPLGEPSTEAKPAHDTRFGSSKTAVNV